MKILVDIVHPADVNFYRNAISLLKSEGHDVVITVLERGGLPSLVEKELGKHTVIGRHSRGFKKIWSNISRVYQLKRFIRKEKPDIVTSFSYYPAAATFYSKTTSVIFHDDPEYWLQFFLCRFFGDWLYVPEACNMSGRKIVTYDSYKEWAYLNPKYFKPKTSVLKKMGLKKKRYVFIREVSSSSLNYGSKEDNDFTRLFRKYPDYRFIVSLEDSSRKSEFKGAEILEGPIDDFYSLLYHAAAVISSGDTMAREAALLGVPSIYIGKREMAINSWLQEFRMMKKADLETLDLEAEIKSYKGQGMAIKSYLSDLKDTTQVIVGAVRDG